MQQPPQIPQAQPQTQQAQPITQQPQPQPQLMQVAPQPPQPPLISFNTTAPEQSQQQVNPYQSIIDQQNEQIAALMAQNQALNGQISQMVQSGAQFYQQPQQQVQQVPGQMQMQIPQQQAQFPNVYQPVSPMQEFNSMSLANDVDYSLEGLAREIGVREGGK